MTTPYAGSPAPIQPPAHHSSVVSFAGGEGLPRPLALLKGVWLALASSYEASTGDARIDQLVSRGGMESMLNTAAPLRIASPLSTPSP